MIELGLQLPGKSSIHYRNYTLQGNHLGEASEYSCNGILGCFWASGSILDGLASNEAVAYTVTNNELWFEHPIQLQQPFNATISPAVGINLAPASLSITNTSQKATKQAILPIPFIGLKLSTPIFERATLTGEAHYFDYESSRWGLLFHNLQAAIEMPITRQTTLSAGYMGYRLDMRYQRGDTNAGLELPLNTPFIKIATRF